MSVLIILPYLTTKAKWFASYIPFIGWLISSISFFPMLIVLGWPALLLLPNIASLGYLVFKDTLNKVQSVGRLYWIVRDHCPNNGPWFGRAFMHEVDPPWRHGKGLQLKVFKRYIQVGICKKHQYDEATGILAAVQGRFLDIEPIDIGKW